MIDACTCCVFRGTFENYSGRVRARCPKCKSLERHRRLAAHFRLRAIPAAGDRILHFAPEPCLAAMLRQYGVDYVDADLRPGRAHWLVDITKIGFADSSFDIVIACHVLEHIVEDRLAMAEIFRVLKPGGCAFLDVPITAERTVEDPKVTEPEERLRLYGQRDHVRRYGQDFWSRLEAAGFTIEDTTINRARKAA